MVNRRSFWRPSVVSGAGHRRRDGDLHLRQRAHLPVRAGKLRPDRVAIRRDGSSQDSVEALANLRRAARDGGELRMIVWRGPGDNPFMTVAWAPPLRFCRCPNRPARAADSIGSEMSRPTHGAVVPIRRAITTVVPPVPQPTSSS